MAAVTIVYPKGQLPKLFVPGDIVVIRHYRESKISALIQAGERTRYGHTAWANYTHAFLITGADGAIVEANGDGVDRRNIREYQDEEFVIIRPNVTDAQRAYAVRFVEAQVGHEYDYLDFVGLGIQAAFAADLSIHHVDAFICSGLVARATEGYTLAGYDRSPEAMMPADLVHHFAPGLHEPPVPISFFGHVLDLVAAVGR